MMRKTRTNLAAAAVLLGLAAMAAANERRMESLGRGMVAVDAGRGKTWLGWRLLADDLADTSFHVYAGREGHARRLTRQPLTGATSCTIPSDPEGGPYFVRPVVAGVEGKPGAAATPLSNAFLEIPLRTIDGYRAGDCSAADLDGDGEFELVVHQVGVSKDNSFPGITSPPILDAYELDGTFLWTGASLIRRLGAAPGETLSVRLRKADARVVEMPDDLAAALRAADRTGRWEELTPGKRCSLLYGIDSAKRADTRARRIAALVTGLDDARA